MIGYARVSTTTQKYRLQLDALKAAGCTRIFKETASGTKRTRPKLAAALKALHRGDTLLVWRLDRWGRDLYHVLETVYAMEDRGIVFRSLMEGFDTSTPMGKFNMQIYGAVAELECGINRQRTNAGLAAARSRGRVGGRPRAMTDEDVVRARVMLADTKLKAVDVARHFGVATSTLYRHLRRVPLSGANVPGRSI